MVQRILVSALALVLFLGVEPAAAQGAITCGTATSTGVHTIDLDGPDGITGPITTSCDMDTDGGGWVLMSHSGPTVPVNHWAAVAPFFSTIFTGMEIRYEAVTSQGRTYWQYNQVTNVFGTNYDSSDAWFGSCKLDYADTYAGDDWVTQPDGSNGFCRFHACANGDPQNFWQNNVVTACHRSLRADDGSLYVAEKNTFFPAQNAYCGGLRKDVNFIQSAGCGVAHTFETAGPEGIDPLGNYSDAINGVTDWRVWVRSDQFYTDPLIGGFAGGDVTTAGAAPARLASDGTLPARWPLAGLAALVAALVGASVLRRRAG